MISKIVDRLSGYKRGLSKMADGRAERLDVLRMGVESAWAELKTAAKTAMAQDPNATNEDHPAEEQRPSAKAA